MMTVPNITKLAQAYGKEGWQLFMALEDALIRNEFERIKFDFGFVTRNSEEVKQWFQQMLDKINAHG